MKLAEKYNPLAFRRHLKRQGFPIVPIRRTPMLMHRLIRSSFLHPVLMMGPRGFYLLVFPGTSDGSIRYQLRKMETQINVTDNFGSGLL